MLKSNNFIFTVHPVRFIYICSKVCVLPTHTVNNVFFFKRYLPNK